MTDLLAQLLARHHGIPGAVAPRVPSLFEPPSLAAADEPFAPRAPAATSPALTPEVDASFDAPRPTVLSAAPAPWSTPAAPTRPVPPATHRSAPAPLAVDRALASTPMPDGATAKERAAPPAAAATASVRASRTPEEAMRTERVPSPVRAPPTVRPTRASSSVPVQATATTPAPPTAPPPPVVSALQPLATRPARPEPPPMAVRPTTALRSDMREPAAPQPVPRDTTPRDTPPGPERPSTPVIEVTIGRIEIRARAPERAPQPATAALTSLDQYMRQHADRRRP